MFGLAVEFTLFSMLQEDTTHNQLEYVATLSPLSICKH